MKITVMLCVLAVAGFYHAVNRPQPTQPPQQPPACIYCDSEPQDGDSEPEARVWCPTGTMIIDDSDFPLVQDAVVASILQQCA